MRVSTAYYYETSTMALMDKQSALHKTQQQLDTGRRIVTPSDDPIGATHAIQTSQAVSESATKLNNISVAKGYVEAENNLLGAVREIINNARTVAANSKDHTANSQERTNLKNYLTQLYDSLVGYANERDSEGNYVFSGYAGSTKPFDNTVVPANYTGDNGQRSIAITSSRNIPVSDSGAAVFSVGTVNDPFVTINQLISDLDPTTGLTGSAFDTAVETAFQRLSASVTNVENINAQVGARMQELDIAEKIQRQFNLQHQNELARVENVDMQQAAVLLKMQQTTLEASQQAFVKTSNLNLFNFI